MLALERRGLDEDRTLVESMSTIEGTGQMTVGEWPSRKLIPEARALRSDPKRVYMQSTQCYHKSRDIPSIVALCCVGVFLCSRQTHACWPCIMKAMLSALCSNFCFAKNVGIVRLGGNVRRLINRMFQEGPCSCGDAYLSTPQSPRWHIEARCNPTLA